MRRLIGCFGACWVALAGGAAQAVDRADFCGEVLRMMAAARETPTFASLETDRPWLGFAGSSCFRVSAGKAAAYRCHRSLAPPDLSRNGLVERTRGCLPAAVEVETDAYGERRLRYREYDIDIGESGTDEAHVGRSVSFQVTLRR